MEDGRIRFDRTDEIDWEGTAAGLRLSPETASVEELCCKPEPASAETLSEKEITVIETLSRRGASFMQALNNVLPGESPYDTLLSLMEKGLVCADSFLPVRQWQNREKIKKSAARQRIGARVKALNAACPGPKPCHACVFRSIPGRYAGAISWKAFPAHSSSAKMISAVSQPGCFILSRS